jgi:RES domain-containing protein
MVVWRVCKAKHAASGLDGIGAAKTGNRWNEAGVRVAYTSSSLSLAALELVVHVDALDVPGDLVALSAEFPRGTKIGVLTRSLPPDWRVMPAPASTAALGTRWARRAKTLVLKVPSVIVPSEFNYLVNPRHADFGTIVLRRPQPFTFDPRLFR